MENEQQKDEAREAAVAQIVTELVNGKRYRRHSNGSENVSLALSDAFDSGYTAGLERQQSAWVPIRSEDDRPKEFGTYLATVKFDNAAPEVMEVRWTDVGWVTTGMNLWDSDVIAWAERPAPYIQHLEQQGGEND